MCAKVCALWALLLASVAGYGQNNVIDEVVWVVGDEAILKSDVEAERLDAQMNGRRFDGDPYCVIPEQLAIQKLFLHQAEIDSIEVSEQEVLSRLEQQTNWLIDQIGSKEKMEEYYNKTSTQIREMLRENIRNGLTVEKMQREIVGDIKIVPADVRRYFKNLPQDSIPYVPTQVEVQIVTLEPKIPQEEIERVKKALRDYTEQINKGEIAFSTLARLYSEDEGTRRRGGELGFMGRGQLVPEYANVAFNLQDPKKVSKIVESEFGFHIIQLIEKRGDRINTRHILLKPKVEEKDMEASLLRLDSIAKDIRNEKFTFDEAATFLSQDKDTRNNYGIMYNKENASSHFTLEELPVVVARVIDGLGVGDISQPFAWVLDNGKTVCAIAKLRSRIDAHQATFNDDYVTLSSMYQAKQGDERIQQWIKEKQRTTYVRINKDSRSCEFKYPHWQFYEGK